jgi:hypothetical protein
MTMTPHAEILSVIAAEFPEWVPTYRGKELGWDKKYIHGFCWHTPRAICSNREKCDKYTAHLAIRDAAWGVVRWWCSKDLGSMSVSEGNPILIGFDSYSGDSRKDVWLGSGPTDADALLAALKYIAGEMGKGKK